MQSNYVTHPVTTVSIYPVEGREGPRTPLPMTNAPTKMRPIEAKNMIDATTRTGLNIYTTFSPGCILVTSRHLLTSFNCLKNYAKEPN